MQTSNVRHSSRGAGDWFVQRRQESSEYLVFKKKRKRRKKNALLLPWAEIPVYTFLYCLHWKTGSSQKEELQNKEQRGKCQGSSVISFLQDWDEVLKPSRERIGLGGMIWATLKSAAWVTFALASAATHRWRFFCLFIYLFLAFLNPWTQPFHQTRRCRLVAWALLKGFLCSDRGTAAKASGFTGRTIVTSPRDKSTTTASVETYADIKKNDETAAGAVPNSRPRFACMMLDVVWFPSKTSTMNIHQIPDRYLD